MSTQPQPSEPVVMCDPRVLELAVELSGRERYDPAVKSLALAIQGAFEDWYDESGDNPTPGTGVVK